MADSYMADVAFAGSQGNNEPACTALWGIKLVAIDWTTGSPIELLGHTLSRSVLQRMRL